MRKIKLITISLLLLLGTFKTEKANADVDTFQCFFTAIDSLIMESWNVNCNLDTNGSAKVTVFGGVGPFSYDWSGVGVGQGQGTDSIFYLGPGFYGVDVYDLGDGSSSCGGVIQVHDMPPIGVPIAPPNPATTCFGVCDGSAVTTPTGGAGGFTFLWSNPAAETTQLADSLCAGLNKVVVTDANGCKDSNTVMVGQPPAVNANVSNTPISCSGDCDALAVSAPSGGVGGFTHSWNPGGSTNDTLFNLCPGTYQDTVRDANGCQDIGSVTIVAPLPLTLVMDSLNESCGGSCDGKAWVVVVGGSLPYTYQWDDPGNQTTDTATGLCSGTYCVVVTDANGCKDSACIDITSPPVLTVSTDTIHVLCSGDSTGSAIALPVGGSGSYTYLWDDALPQTTDTATGLAAGTYCVTVTDSLGCLDSACAEVLEPPLVALATDSIDPLCFGSCDGKAVVIASGGVGGFTYLWNDPGAQTTDTATGLCAGLYRVIVTDANGCADTAFVNLDNPPAISLLTDSIDALCSGSCDGKAIAIASGGSGPLTYLWNDGSPQTTDTATNLCVGTYRVIVTDSNNCKDTAFVNIDQPTPLVLATDSIDVACGGDCTGKAVVTATGGTPSYTYLWNDSLPQSTDTAVGLCAGLYKVIVTDSNNCIDSAFVNIDEPTPLVVTVDSTFISCFGAGDGTATANVSGGTPLYTYLWTNGASSSSVSGLGPFASFCVTVTDSKGCQDSGCVEIFEPPPLTVSMSKTDVVCNGLCNGTGTATPAGGTPPYTYSWDDPALQSTATAGGLCVGTFRVTVTDSSLCTVIDSVSIAEPTPIVPNDTTVPATCGTIDGLAIVNPSGGTPCGPPTPYLINWYNNGPTFNDTLSGLGAGCYNVEIQDCAGCRDTFAVCVANIAATVLTMLDTDITCNGDSNGIGEVQAAGGTPPYTYSWDDPGNQTNAVATNLPPGIWTVTVEDANNCIVFGSVTITEPAPLLAGLSATDVSCFSLCDGKVVSTPTGGTPPYTFSWETGAIIDSITMLCPGFYTDTLTDKNGCITIDSAEIKDRSLLTVTTDSIDILCFGDFTGSAIVIPVGGVPPYTFLWDDAGTQSNDTATGLDTGVYCVVVSDSNGCGTGACVNLDEPPLLTVVMSKTNVTCAGACNGTGTATPSGGVGPYTFSWSNGDTTGTADSLCTGKFYVTVTDNNACFTVDSVIITQPLPLTAIMTKTNVACNGLCTGTGSVAASGGTAPLTYLWSNGDNGVTADSLCAGTYYVTVTDFKGCTLIDSVVITQPNAISLTADSLDILCNGDCTGQADVNTTGGTTPYTFQWDDSDFQTDSTATGLCMGTYCVTVTDFKGCKDSICVNIDEPAPILPGFNTIPATCGLFPCDGVASSTPSGGAGGYLFNWTNVPTSTNDTIFQRCAGIYNLDITDGNGCTESFSVGISNLGAPIIDSLDSAMITCFGDSDGTATVHIVPGSGNPPYTFLWDDPLAQADSTADSLPAGTWLCQITDNIGCLIFADVIITEPTKIISFMQGRNISCAGACDGRVTTNPSGGVPLYTHIWDPGGSVQDTITGLCPGTYTDTITDASGCFIVDSVTLTEPLALTVLITDSTNISCNGLCDGSATVTPSGGTLPYTYAWSTSPVQTDSTAGGLCADSVYQVIVTDAKGCQDSITVILSQPAVLQASIVDSTNVSCNGLCDGDATVRAAGGTAPFTYAWNNGPSFDTDSLADTLCAGPVYKVMVTDTNGCKDSVSVTLSEPLTLTASVIDSTDVSCNGGCNGNATVMAGGGTAPYTYSWDNAPDFDTDTVADSLCIGIYRVTVTDTLGCTATDSVTITEPAVLNASIADSVNISCKGLCDGIAVGAANGGTAPYTFSWLPSGQVNDTVTGRCAGSTDTLIATDSLGCMDTAMVSLTEPDSLLISVVDSENVTCFGLCNGIGRTSTTGGAPAYTYTWSLSADTLDSAVALCADTMNVVTVTDQNGCTARDSVMLSQPPEIFATVIDSVNASCYALCDGQAVLTGSGGSPPLTYTWQSGESGDSAFSLCADSNLFGVVLDSIGCSDTAFFTISQPAEIIIAFTDSAAALCNGTCEGMATVAISGGVSPYSLLWNNAPDNDSGVVADSLCAGYVVVTVTDSTGCINTDSIDILQPAVFVIDTVSTTSAACDSTCDAMAVVFGAGGTTPYTFVWNDTVPTVNDTAINLCASTYIVYGTDSNGCQATDTIVILGPDSLGSNIVQSSMVTCFGACDGSATVRGYGGVGAYTYSWVDTALGLTIAGPSLADSAITNLCGGKTYFAVIRDANGCITTAPVVIMEPALLAPNICSVNNVTCNSACDGSATVCPIGGTAPYTFYWSNGDTNATADSLCAGNYQVTVNDSNNCLAIDTLVIIAQPDLLSCLFTDTGATGCGMDSATGYAIVQGNGGIPPYQYSWDVFTLGSETDTLADSLMAGTYHVTVTDSNGCQSICTIAITDSSDMSASITDSNMISCFGSCDGNATITVTGSAMPYTYSWWDSNDASIGEDSSFADSLCAGTYRSVTKSAAACFRSIPVTITQPDSLVAAISDTVNALCFADSNGRLVVSPTGGTPPYTYAWFDSTGALVDSLDTLKNIPAGLYCVFVTDSNGCSDSVCVQVTEPNKLYAGITDTIRPACSNTCDGRLVAGAAGGTMPYVFSWNDTAGTTNDTLANLCVNTFIVTVTDTNGCVAIDTAVLAPLVVVDADGGTDLQLCQGDIAVLYGTGGSVYQWYFDTVSVGGDVGSGDTLVHTPPVTGAHVYILVVGDSVCSDTDSVSVYIVPVAVDACCDGTIGLGECTELLAMVTNGVTFSWSPGGSLNDSNIFNPVACPGENTVYTLTATNDSNCVGTDTVTILVKPAIPDGFTPQGDGFNDVWEIPLFNNYPNAEVQVYNRWGQLIFDSPEGDKYATKFDGTYKGKDLPVGTYYYVIKLNDGVTEPITGPVTIMR